MTRFILLLAVFALSLNLFAQEEKEKEEIPDGWQKGAGIGLDLAQLLQINPKQGAGQNRLGLGGAITSFANLKKGRAVWDNSLLWQFGVQRLGSGIIAQGAAAKIPFQKAVDDLRIGSKYGYQIKEGGKLYYSINSTFLSQVTPTYQFPDTYPGNFISDFIDSGETPLSKFLAPATFTLSAGLDYKPNEHFSLFYSPFGSRFIIVANDVIASRGVHGNDVSGEPNEAGIYPEFKNVEAQLGSLAQLQYNNKFAGDKITFTSNLGLYSNYLQNPQNIDFDWQNALAYAITENLQLSLFLNAFYDDDVRVQITDYDQPNGVNGLGKRVSITQQFLVTYARTF